MNFVRIMTGTSEMKPLPVHYGFSLRVPDGTILNCPHGVGKMNCPHRVGRIGRHRQITHLARNAFTIHYVPLGLPVIVLVVSADVRHPRSTSSAAPARRRSSAGRT